ncbi:hypothetical protein Pelo_12744 [Pelomyxa schiedti]|nr:hypothetical protein Pelo_12744 [Pelomyxa schiedti]
MQPCTYPCLYTSPVVSTTISPTHFLVFVIDLSVYRDNLTSTTQIGLNVTSLVGGQEVQTVIVDTNTPSVYNYDDAPTTQCICHLASSHTCDPSMNSTYFECEAATWCGPSSSKTYYVSAYNNAEKTAHISAAAYLYDDGNSCEEASGWWVPVVIVFSTLGCLAIAVAIMIVVIVVRGGFTRKYAPLLS